MPNPLRSEEEAFRLVLLVVVFALPVIVAALLFGSGVALGLFGGLCYAGLFALMRRRRARLDEARRRTQEPDAEP